MRLCLHKDDVIARAPERIPLRPPARPELRKRRGEVGMADPLEERSVAILCEVIVAQGRKLGDGGHACRLQQVRPCLDRALKPHQAALVALGLGDAHGLRTTARPSGR